MTNYNAENFKHALTTKPKGRDMYKWEYLEGIHEQFKKDRKAQSK